MQYLNNSLYLNSMQTNIKITGMHCPSCKTLLEDVIHDVPGVNSCMIDAEKHVGTIEHDDSFNFDNVVKEVANLDKYTIAKI